MSKKIVLVSGATGKQGGSLVEALLAHGGYGIRALSRKVDSDAAKALAAKGVEVVPGDLSNKDSLIQATKGVYAAFGVSIPEIFSGVSEEVQGRNLTDACKANNVDLLVWSSLPSCEETSGGKYIVKGFDDKKRVEDYIQLIGQPSTIFRTGGFASNIIQHGMLQRDKQDSSKYHLFSPFLGPDNRQPWTYVEKDVGPVVLATIDKWEDPAWRAELRKEPIPLVSWEMAGKDVAETIAKLTGNSVDWITIDPGNAMHEQLKTMYRWCCERLWGYGDTIPVPLLLKLGVKLHTLEDYVHDAVIPFINSQ